MLIHDIAVELSAAIFLYVSDFVGRFASFVQQGIPFSLTLQSGFLMSITKFGHKSTEFGHSVFKYNNLL
jgi:hypothetical protein